MENLNLNLQELKAISHAIKFTSSGDHEKGLFNALSTIDKAIESCEKTNDGLKDRYGKDETLEASANLTLCISNPTDDIKECNAMLSYINTKLANDDLTRAEVHFYRNSRTKKRAELNELINSRTKKRAELNELIK